MSGYGIGGGVEDSIQVNYYQQKPCHLVNIVVNGITTTLGQAIGGGSAGVGTAYIATSFAGVICDGVTDSGAALNAALESIPPGSTMFIPGPLYTTQTIVVSNGRVLQMPPGTLVRPVGSSTLLVGTIAIIGTSNLSPVVEVVGNEGGLVHVWITRNGTPGAGTVGLQCYGQDQIYWSIRIYNHARGVQVGGYSENPAPNVAITTRFDHSIFWNCTEDFTYLVQAPETTFYDCRWGINGALDPSGANALVTIDGDNNNVTAGSPGTISFIRCQFNTDAQQSYSVRFISVNTGIFNFTSCYSGGATQAFCYVDPSCTLVQDLIFDSSTFDPIHTLTGETFILDTGKKINALKVIGCEFAGTGGVTNVFSLSGSNNSAIIGNTLSGASTMQIDAMNGGCCIGNSGNTLQITGAFTNDFIVANNSFATITQTATGSVSYVMPTANYGQQLTLGTISQAGRVDFRRGTDGLDEAWCGIEGAGDTNLALVNTSGSPIVYLDARNDGGIVSFRINSVEAANVTVDGVLVEPNGNGSGGLTITDAAGTITRMTQYQTAGVNRWTTGASQATESGGNVGSNYGIDRYSDSGTFIDTPFGIQRATGLTSVTFLAIGTSSGPTITSGTGAPTGTQPKGSIWMRTDGGVGTTMYVSQGGGTWNPVAGV